MLINKFDQLNIIDTIGLKDTNAAKQAKNLIDKDIRTNNLVNYNTYDYQLASLALVSVPKNISFKVMYLYKNDLSSGIQDSIYSLMRSLVHSSKWKGQKQEQVPFFIYLNVQMGQNESEEKYESKCKKRKEAHIIEINESLKVSWEADFEADSKANPKADLKGKSCPIKILPQNFICFKSEFELISNCRYALIKENNNLYPAFNDPEIPQAFKDQIKLQTAKIKFNSAAFLSQANELDSLIQLTQTDSIQDNNSNNQEDSFDIKRKDAQHLNDRFRKIIYASRPIRSFLENFSNGQINMTFTQKKRFDQQEINRLIDLTKIWLEKEKNETKKDFDKAIKDLTSFQAAQGPYQEMKLEFEAKLSFLDPIKDLQQMADFVTQLMMSVTLNKENKQVPQFTIIVYVVSLFVQPILSILLGIYQTFKYHYEVAERVYKRDKIKKKNEIKAQNKSKELGGRSLSQLGEQLKKNVKDKANHQQNECERLIPEVSFGNIVDNIITIWYSPTSMSANCDQIKMKLLFVQVSVEWIRGICLFFFLILTNDKNNDMMDQGVYYFTCCSLGYKLLSTTYIAMRYQGIISEVANSTSAITE